MATGPGVMTAEELLELPDGARYELVRGQLRVMSLAGHVHGRIAARVLLRLGTFVDANGLGVTYAAETGFMLHRAPDTVRAPDASFVSSARLPAVLVESQSYLQGAPDLAVEVLSPSDRPRKVAEKVEDWLAAGCRAVVVLNPTTNSAAIHRPDGRVDRVGPDDDLTVSELLPGWSVSLKDIFA